MPRAKTAPKRNANTNDIRTRPVDDRNSGAKVKDVRIPAFDMEETRLFDVFRAEDAVRSFIGKISKSFGKAYVESQREAYRSELNSFGNMSVDDIRRLLNSKIAQS